MTSNNQPAAPPVNQPDVNSSDRYRESEEMLLELRLHGERLPGQTVGEYLTKRNRLRIPREPVKFYGID